MWAGLQKYSLSFFTDISTFYDLVSIFQAQSSSKWTLLRFCRNIFGTRFCDWGKPCMNLLPWKYRDLSLLLIIINHWWKNCKSAYITLWWRRFRADSPTQNMENHHLGYKHFLPVTSGTETINLRSPWRLGKCHTSLRTGNERSTADAGMTSREKPLYSAPKDLATLQECGPISSLIGFF